MKNINDITELKDFGNIEFIAKQVVEGFITGLHKSPFHGFSVEFAEHRLYNTGESTKNIDWKLFARTDKLFVKRYEEETNLRSRIIIDTSSSMLFPYKNKKVHTKLAFSIYCAAALIYILRKQRDAIGLTFFSDEIELHTRTKTSITHSRFLYGKLNELLQNEKQKLNKTTNTGRILHLTADKIHRRSLVIIFSDMFSNESSEKLFASLQHLKHNKHDVILFHVTDKKYEEQFSYKNRPHKFVDMETEEIIKLNPNEVREHFKNKTSSYYNNLKLKCGKFKIDFVAADINSDFKDVIIPYLLKRKKLF